MGVRKSVRLRIRASVCILTAPFFGGEISSTQARRDGHAAAVGPGNRRSGFRLRPPPKNLAVLLAEAWHTESGDASTVSGGLSMCFLKLRKFVSPVAVIRRLPVLSQFPPGLAA